VSDSIQKAIRQINSKRLRVGWGENQKYPAGKNGKSEFVATIAAQNEFGNPALGIPVRSFMRVSVQQHQETWKKILAKGIINAIKGNQSVASAMETAGLVVAGDVRKAITEVTSPPLKTATVKARLKGKKQGKAVSLTVAKPLVDTGIMLNSLTSEVVE
jgi:hypothetical protein